MLKQTLPFARRTFFQNKWTLIGLLIISLLLGVVPTLKSELEAGLIDQIVKVINDSSYLTIRGVITVPLRRFASGTNVINEDLPQKIAGFLFGDIALGLSLIVYLLVSVCASILEVISTSIRANFEKYLFSRFRTAALIRGLKTDSSDLPSLANIEGQYSAAIQQGATNVSQTYGYILEAGQHIFTLITTIYLISTKSFIFSLSCLILIFGQVTISFVQAKKLENERGKLGRQREALVAHTDDILSKREMILAYEQQDRYANKLEKITDSFAGIGKRLAVKESVFKEVSQLLTDYGRISILLIALGIAIILGKATLEKIGDVYFLTSIYVRLFVPASNILGRFDDIRRSQATSRTFLEVLSKPDANKLATNSLDLIYRTNHPTEIEFQNVNFAYKDKPILNDCSFVIPPGRTTLLLGCSGSGKTTIARILLGFWRIKSGDILVDGKSINQLTGEELRLLMSYVSQKDYVVDETVFENLKWGETNDSPISSEEVLRVLKELGIPFGEGNEILNKPARELSIGQQQRLSLARMMLDKSHLLILDEPLAGVDVFTIEKIYPSIANILKSHQRTVLIISHRLAFASLADHVVILDDGHIVETGSPKDLYSKGGVFRDLYNTAMKELKLS